MKRFKKKKNSFPPVTEADIERARRYLMGTVGGLAMHDVRRTQAVLERLAQQGVAAVTYKDKKIKKCL